MLNQEDQTLFLEISRYLWGLPTLENIPETLDYSSILEDMKRLVSSVMSASGLFDHGSEHSSSFYRLQSLRQRCIPEMRHTHAHEGEFGSAESRPPPAPDIQETPHINVPQPPDPEGGHLSTFDEIVYLFAGAIFGAILLFLYRKYSGMLPASVHANMTTVFRYGDSSLQPPFLVSNHGQPLIPDQIMGRNCIILALYLGTTSHVDPGTMPHRITPERAEEHLAAFESHTEDNSITINTPG